MAKPTPSTDYIDYVRLNRPNLFDYINQGVFENETPILEFISLVKWPKDTFECKNQSCILYSVENKEFLTITAEVHNDGHYKDVMEFTRICNKCKYQESPTHGTTISHIHQLTPVFEIGYYLLLQKKLGRLTNLELRNLLARKIVYRNADAEDEKQNLTGYEKRELEFYTWYKELGKEVKVLEALEWERNIEKARLRTDNTSKNLLQTYFSADCATETLTWHQFLKDQLQQRNTIIGLIKVQLDEETGPAKIEFPLSDPTIIKFRYLFQQYINDLKLGRHTGSSNPFGVQHIILKRGSESVTIYVARQHCPKGIIRAIAYRSHTIDNLKSFVNDFLPDDAELIFYGFDDKFREDLLLFRTVDFDKYYLDFDIYNFHVNEVVNWLKMWFASEKGLAKIREQKNNPVILTTETEVSGYDDPVIRQLRHTNEYPTEVISAIDLKDLARLQLHVNECIFLKFYDGLDLATLMAFVIMNPSESLAYVERNRLSKKRSLENSPNRISNRGPSPFSNQTKIESRINYLDSLD